MKSITARIGKLCLKAIEDIQKEMEKTYGAKISKTKASDILGKIYLEKWKELKKRVKKSPQIIWDL